MKILHGLEALEQPLDQSVLTVGNFDGVHRAHLQLLAQAGLFAANTGGPVVVLTFEPHPLAVLRPGKAPERLTTEDEKLRCLRAAGADIVVVAHSEPDLLAMEAERFIEEILVRRFRPTHIVEGPSFGFGRGRRGTSEMLSSLAPRFNCEVHIVEPVTLQIEEGETLMVSSSLIRRLLLEGKVHRAALCLGRPYALIGEVGEGDRRGRTLGFPTANVDTEGQLVPGDGVYAGEAQVENDTYLAAISIGNTPTFEGTKRRFEVHLLDFDGDLYGRLIRVRFERPLRGQQTFASPDALAEQLGRDVQAVRAAAENSETDSPDDAGTGGYTGQAQPS